MTFLFLSTSPYTTGLDGMILATEPWSTQTAISAYGEAVSAIVIVIRVVDIMFSCIFPLRAK